VTESDPEVMSFDRKSPEVAVEGRKLAYAVHFTSCRAVAGWSRQSRNRKWRHVTSGGRKWSEVTSFDRN